jgi:hypothetical protein
VAFAIWHDFFSSILKTQTLTKDEKCCERRYVLRTLRKKRLLRRILEGQEQSKNKARLPRPVLGLAVTVSNVKREIIH